MLYAGAVLRRAASLSLSLGLALLPACTSRSDGKSPPKASPADAAMAAVAADAGAPTTSLGAAPELHGERWSEGDDPDAPKMGGFTMFKEAWMYVDGKPLGVLREVEFPPMPIAWKEDVEYLDFNKGDPGPHEKKFKVKRWRVADYLTAAGVDFKKIKLVAVHGGRGVVYIPGDIFRKVKDRLTFDLTGNSNDKLRVFLPDDLPRTTSFDRYVAISVIIDKPVPGYDTETNELMLDGEPVGGIPYHGTPLRGGIRIYLDHKLALVVKRNALGADGRIADDKWNVGKLLAAHGVKADGVVAADIVHGEERTRMPSVDVATLDFTSSEKASGKILVGPDQIETNAILLYTKGKTPPVWKRPPIEVYLDGSVKTEF